MEVLTAVHEVEGGQQHLARTEPVALEGVAPHPHQPVLAHGGNRLECGQVGGARLVGGQTRPAGGDGSGGDHHHPASAVAGRGHLGGQLVDGVGVHTTRRGGDRRGADLHYQGARRRVVRTGRARAHGRRRLLLGLPVNSGWSRYQTKDSSAISTRSPSLAPARARARSTPRRRRRPWMKSAASSEVTSLRATARSATFPTTRKTPSPIRSTENPSGRGRWMTMVPSASGSVERASDTRVARRPTRRPMPNPVTAEMTRSGTRPS